MPGPFFIVTTGRSGSTTIARALSVLHNVVALHEPAPELVLESSGYRYGTTSGEEVRTLLRETRGPIAARSIYVESNQTLSLIIPEIIHVFPEARFIWLIRNGPDVVASAMQKQWYTGHGENQDRYEDCPPSLRQWIDGRIEADRCGEMSADAWAATSRFEKCCWYWAYVNRVIEEDLGEHASDRFMLVRLEALGRSLHGVFDWMGVKSAVRATVPHTNKAKREPYAHGMWSALERDCFLRHCGALMDRFYSGWRRDNGDIVGVPNSAETTPQSFVGRHPWAARLLNALWARNPLGAPGT